MILEVKREGPRGSVEGAGHRVLMMWKAQVRWEKEQFMGCKWQRCTVRDGGCPESRKKHGAARECRPGGYGCA